MAFEIIPGFSRIGPMTNTLGAAPAVGTNPTLTAAAHKLCVLIHAPKDGTLHSFEVCLGIVTQAPADGLKFSFQGIANSGGPDNTIDQFRVVTAGITTGAWLAPPGPLTDDGTDEGDRRVVSAGEGFACVIEFESFDASDSLAFGTSNESIFNSYLSTRKSTDSGASYSTVTTQNQLRIALRYNDGYEFFADAINPIVSYASPVVSASTDPDEWGMRFILPFNFELAGIRTHMTFTTIADPIVLRLYDSADNVLDEVTYPELGLFGPAATVLIPWFPLSRISPLIAGAEHRVTFRPAAGNVIFREFVVSSNAHLNAVPGGIECYKTTRNNDGAWTDSDVTRPWIQLAISRFEAISGGTTGSLTFIG